MRMRMLLTMSPLRLMWRVMTPMTLMCLRVMSLCVVITRAHANMWDDPDGHVSEGACAEDDCSECSLDELRSTSSLWYDMESIEEASDFDSDCSCDEELTSRLYCRAVIEEVPSEPDRAEVILDSGADCTVLPLSYQAVGHKDSSVSKSILLDAQGNKIEGGESRVFVNFEIDTPDEDSVISFKDSVVLGNVQQPLFRLGKLMKRGWVPVCDEYDSWYMQKGEAWFPVHWSRNSLATHMRISRLEEMVAQGDGEDADQRLGEPSAADQRLGDASVEGGARAESFLA